MPNDNNFQYDSNAHNLLRIGELLQGGKYRIVRYLASGGFGNTYVATNTLLDIPLVVKEFYIKGVTCRHNDGRSVSVSLAENRPMWDKMLEKFKREARHMFKINHPNIVRVHDFFEENATAYYVMDLVNGESLGERMKRTGKPVGEAELTSVILPQALNALERIHSENIWHLDIKPANLMLESGGTVKLIDFGASKQSSPGEGTTTTSLAYTPGYASPEQVLQNTKAIGPWSDIYSLGATIYNLLTRRTPPSQTDIDDDGPQAFDFSGVNVSERMRYLIIQMMLTPRRQRPQSVAEVRQILGGPLPTVLPHVNAPRPVAHAPQQRPNPQPAPQRHAPVAGIDESERTMAVSDSRQPAVKQRAPQVAAVGAVTAEKQRSKRPLIIAAAAAVALVIAGAVTFYALRLGDDSSAPAITTSAPESASVSIATAEASSAAASESASESSAEQIPAPAPSPKKETTARRQVQQQQQVQRQRTTTTTRTQNPATQRTIPAQGASNREIHERIRRDNSGNSSVNVERAGNRSILNGGNRDN